MNCFSAPVETALRTIAATQSVTAARVMAQPCRLSLALFAAGTYVAPRRDHTPIVLFSLDYRSSIYEPISKNAPFVSFYCSTHSHDAEAVDQPQFRDMNFIICLRLRLAQAILFDGVVLESIVLALKIRT